MPAANLLGEIGKGHKIAFNTLNYGRLKLGAMCSGGARLAIGEAARYAGAAQAVRQADRLVRRHQAEARRHGRAAVRGRSDALPHRRADRRRRSQGGHAPQQILAALEEFAIEASILKVASSETLDFVLDENVQIHGGNGFVRDYPAERHYRDARVNRIFEGTNEINRLLIPGMLAPARASRAALPLIPAAKRLMDEIMSPPSMDAAGDAPLDAERRAVDGDEEGRADGARHRDADLRREAGRRAGSAARRRGHHHRRLRVGERAAARAPLHGRRRGLHDAAARVYVNDAAGRVEASAKTALAAMAEGDTLRTLLAALRRLLKVTPINTVVAAPPAGGRHGRATDVSLLEVIPPKGGNYEFKWKDGRTARRIR